MAIKDPIFDSNLDVSHAFSASEAFWPPPFLVKFDLFIALDNSPKPPKYKF